jgi:hypothetical protein
MHSRNPHFCAMSSAGSMSTQFSGTAASGATPASTSLGSTRNLEFFKAGEDQPHHGTTIAGQVVFNMSIDDRAQLPRFEKRLAAEQGAPHAHRHGSKRPE